MVTTESPASEGPGLKAKWVSGGISKAFPDRPVSRHRPHPPAACPSALACLGVLFVVCLSHQNTCPSNHLIGFLPGTTGTHQAP